MSGAQSPDGQDLQVLSISLDSSIADRTSGVYERQREYASHFASYTVVTKTDEDDANSIEDGPLHVYPTNSANRYGFLLDAYRLGVSQGDVDVVTTQDTFALGLVGLALAWQLDARLHVQVHTDFLHNDAWRRESLDHRIYDRLGRFVLPRGDAIRVGTDYEAKKIREFVGEEIPIHVAPVKMQFDELVSESFDEEQLRTELSIGDRPVVLFAGRFVSAKNLDKWLSIANEVRNRATSSPVFVLVGDGPERESINAKAVSRGMTDDLRLPGWVDHETLGDYYALADVFLITSAYEGTSRVVVEAGMNGTPVVATPFAGVQDNIVDGETGLVAGDAESLAEGVMRLLEYPDERERIGQAAREFLRTKYRKRSLTDEYVEFIKAR